MVGSLMQEFVSFFRVAAPFSVARCVMEKSPHSMLVGQGAQDFAATNGFPVESNSALQTQKSREAFEVIIAKGTFNFHTCTNRIGSSHPILLLAVGISPKAMQGGGEP